MRHNNIILGLVWYKDGFREEVTKLYKNGKCQITETWISEDTGKECIHKSNQVIVTDKNGEQYTYDPKYEKYANPGHDENDEYSWWARTYACGACNWDVLDKKDMSFQEWLDKTFYPGFDASGLDDDEYYELEDLYNYEKEGK